MNKSILSTFIALLITFLIIVGELFIPPVRNLFTGSALFLIPIIIFSLLGLCLLVLVLKSTLIGRLKKFLILTSLTSLAFFVSIFLHNGFYALGEVLGHINILQYLFAALNIIFFLIAVFVCPLAFLVGLIGSLVLLITKRKSV